MRKLVLLSFLLCLNFVSAQEDTFSLVEYNVDFLPENYGGRSQLKRLFISQINYPPQALKKKTEGRVTIKFVVDTSGKTKDFRAVQSDLAILAPEAIRLGKLIQWEPALKNGKPVSVNYSIDVPFSLSSLKKKKKWLKGLEELEKIPCDSSGVIYPKPEKPATPFYGKDSLLSEIASQLVYPELAKVQNLEGTVRLEFIVETNGLISNVRIVKGVGGGCNEEAIAVIEDTKWFPAMHNNVRVRSKVEYPIQFRLSQMFHDNSLGEQRRN